MAEPQASHSTEKTSVPKAEKRVEQLLGYEPSIISSDKLAH
jgi:hypothetical protein